MRMTATAVVVGSGAADHYRYGICNAQCRFCAPGERNTRYFLVYRLHFARREYR